jgi:hypothetical protein
MSELNEVVKSLEITLKNSNLHNVTINLSEVVVDNLLKDGIVKDIPIIGTIVGTGKIALGIKEKLFLKKILYFISELKEIPAHKRQQIIDKIDSSKKYRINVGEKLLYIIEKCDDHEVSQIIARLFAAFIKELLSYDEFLRAISVVEKIPPIDLLKFVGDDWIHIYLDEAGDYLNSGLVVVDPLELSVEDQWDHHNSYDKYIVNGGNLTVSISGIGKKIREILKGYNDKSSG